MNQLLKRFIAFLLPAALFGSSDLFAAVTAKKFRLHSPRLPYANPPFWIAKDLKIFEEYGLDVELVYVAGVAKPDGLTVGSISSGIYCDQLVARKEVQYDWAKFSWIGSSDQTNQILLARGDTAYKSLEDIRKAAEPPVGKSFNEDGSLPKDGLRLLIEEARRPPR
jgi:ABC-type nitrate/sulfonate/bicarbonate transport system substrate-binding protein